MARPGLGSVGRKGHSGAGHETALRASLPGRLRPGRCGADGAPARDLQFELAARFRDEIADLKRELRGMDAAGLK